MVGQFAWMKRARVDAPVEDHLEAAEDSEEADSAGVGEVDEVTPEVDTSCLRFHNRVCLSPLLLLAHWSIMCLMFSQEDTTVTGVTVTGTLARVAMVVVVAAEETGASARISTGVAAAAAADMVAQESIGKRMKIKFEHEHL